MVLTEAAPAKVNLTLRIAGRRPDGFHEIRSLVAFAGIDDTLALAPGDRLALETTGPFAKRLDSSNLVLQAAEKASEAWPGLRTGTFHLRKELPVAAGLGGGSADAAAAFRLLMRANPGQLEAAELHGIAAGIGADVPVCLEPGAAWVSGIGEKIVPVENFARPAAILVNPGVPVSTANVFRALAAHEPSTATTQGSGPGVETLDALVEFMRATGNDLEKPACELAPVIAEVKAAIEATAGCLVAGMSGSGATCFGLYAETGGARSAADAVSCRQPEWWVRATTLS